MAKTHSNSSAQDNLAPPPPPPPPPPTPPSETQTVDHSSESDTTSLVCESLEKSLANLSMEDRHLNKRESESNRAWVAEQERRIELEVIRAICSGKTDSLKPNSGEAVTIGNHYICIFLHEDGVDPSYRTWEWHGHVMRYDDRDGYTAEHIYGHHLERLSWYDEEDEEEDEVRTEGFAFPWPFRRT